MYGGSGRQHWFMTIINFDPSGFEAMASTGTKKTKIARGVNNIAGLSTKGFI